jgi:tetratricopeptide (TPR) repeat protein
MDMRQFIPALALGGTLLFGAAVAQAADGAPASAPPTPAPAAAAPATPAPAASAAQPAAAPAGGPAEAGAAIPLKDIAPDAGPAAPIGDAAADLPATPEDTPQREAALRQQLQQQPSVQAYLDLLGLLEARLARLAPGDEEVALRTQLDQLWQQALSAYADDPRLLLANGDRLRARGSLKAAWEAYARGETLAREDPRWTARMGALTQQAQDYPGAIKLYAESLALQYNPVVIAQVAECFRLNGDNQAQLNTWNKALALHGDDPQLHMQYGLALYRLGSYQEALAQYQRGAQLAPAGDLFHNRAALCLYRLGQTADALAEVQQALKLKPRAVYYYNLAVGADTLGQTDAAEQWYDSGLKAFPSDQQLQRGYSAFLAAHGRGGEAVQQLADSDLSSVSHYANLAGLAEEQGNIAAATSAWQNALQQEPASPWLLAAAASFYARTGQADALRSLVREARSRLDDGQFADLLTAVRDAWIDKKNYSGGVACFQTLLQDHPDTPAVYNNLGLLLHLSGDSAGGLAMVRRGLHDVNSTALGRYLEVFLAAHVQGPDAALALCPALVAAPDADYAAFELYCGLLTDAKRWDDVAGVAAQGLGRFPHRAPLVEYRARGLFNAGHYTDTVNLLTGADYALVDFPAKPRLLGLSYLELGNYPKAASALSAAAQAAPGSAEAQANLGEALFWQNDLPGARRALTQALALDGKNAAAQVWLGWTLLAQGDAAGAQQALSEAAAQPGADALDRAWTALGQARTAAQQGDRAAAQQSFQQARSLGAGSGSARFDAALASAKQELGL